MSNTPTLEGLKSSNPPINDSIVASTINYYGHGLLKQLADFKPDVIPNSAVTQINYHSFQARANKLAEHEGVKFYTTAVDFILSNAEHLFSQFNPNITAPVDHVSQYGYTDKYKILPPIEYYLQANKKMRMQQFYKDIRRGDILICRALKVDWKSSQQSLKVVARDGGPHMMLGKGIYITVNLDLSKTRIPKLDEGSVAGTWATNTLLRVEVLTIEKTEDVPSITVGTLGNTLFETGKQEMNLGKGARTDIPPIIDSMDAYTRDSVGSFDSCLRRMEGFKNPRSVQHLTKQLGLSMTNSSLMRTLRDGFPPTLEFRQLRRQQLSRWAHKHVADGVAHFKRGEHTEAFQLLNKALHIDPENVEAFVAKGALLANMGSFEKAVEDFECALKHNPEHGNARKYICETLMELGKRHEEEGTLGAAEHCYLRSLKVNPEHKGCFHALAKLHGRAGFKSSSSNDFLEEMSPEEKVKAQLIKTEVKEIEEEEPALKKEEVSVAEVENEPAPAQPRERSLSPLSQKMAMQNNEWRPPSYIQTTSSYFDQQMDSPPSYHPPSEDHRASMEDRKGPIITPFVIGTGKNTFADKSDPAPVHNSEEVEIVDLAKSTPQSHHMNSIASSVRVAITAQTNSLGELTNTTTTSHLSQHPSSITTISETQPSTSGVRSELDTSFDSTINLKPQTQDDLEALSMSLVVLAKRYKAQNNLVRTRLCLEKSLQHNPKHGPTIKALQDLTVTSNLQPSMAPTTSAMDIPQAYLNKPPTEYDNRTSTLMHPYREEEAHPVVYSAYLPPPAAHFPPQPAPYMGVGGYSNPPPTYQNPYAPPVVMTAPPPMVGGPAPQQGKWGTACPPTDLGTTDDRQNAGSSSYASREDREYHDRVDSFLNKLMQRPKPSSTSSKRRTSRSDRSRSRDKRASSGGRSKKRLRESPPPSLGGSQRSQGPTDSRPQSQSSSESSKGSRNKLSRSRERSSKTKSKEPSLAGRRDNRSRKRSRENKKKRKRSVPSSSRSSSRSSSSSSYSSDSSSSYTSSSSEGSKHKRSKSNRKKKKHQRRHHSKRSKKDKSGKDSKDSKINLEDTPLLQGLDKEILKKITEKIQQSNALALDTVIHKKKKKKDKEAFKKREDKEIQKKVVDEKSKKKEGDKRKIEDTSIDESRSSSKSKKNKKAVPDELAESKKKDNSEDVQMSVVAKLKKEASLKASTATTEAAREFKPLDIEKAAQKDTPLNIKALMELPGLEVLQKKLMNYYSKCEVKTQDSPSANGTQKLFSKDDASKSPAAKDIDEKKSDSKSRTTDEPSRDKKSKQPTPSSGRESKSSDKSASSSKSPSTSGKSRGKDSSSSKEDKAKLDACSPEEYGPALPPAPPTAFKSTFQPIALPPKKVIAPARPIFDPTYSFLHNDGSILTPKEFREGFKEAKIQQLKDVVSKAQTAANSINKQHSSDDKRSGRRTSTSLSSPRHSRSMSRSRRSRSSSGRSRSRSRGRRSRSRDRRSRSRRRRSRSRGRRSRSRSRGRDRRSRSRGRGRHSRSPNSRSRSRSPRPRFREGYLPVNPLRGHFRSRARPVLGYARRRTRSRSISPRRQPPRRSQGAAKSFDKEQEKNTPPKTAMFGKWETIDENCKHDVK